MAYVTIQDWMIADLNLSGNELITYAIIYGFSQDGESHFKGSRNYIAKWCGCSVRTVQNILNTLVEKDLVLKYENPGFACEYACKIEKNEPVQKLHTPCAKTAHDNIDNTIKDINTSFRSISDEPTEYDSHGYSIQELKQEFLQPKNKRKLNRKSLYDKCIDEIYNYTDSKNLQDALISYLQLRLSIKDKPIVGVNQWKGLLNKLNDINGDKLQIVNQSIEKGWLSFYEISNSRSRGFVEVGNLSCKQDIRTEEERIAEARKLGLQETF